MGWQLTPFFILKLGAYVDTIIYKTTHMRKDIAININNGAFIENNVNKNREVFDVRIVKDRDNEMLDKFIYMEVDIDNVTINGLPDYIYIPYIPVDKLSYIRLPIVSNLGFKTYLNNPVTNSQWFKICINDQHAPASMLPIVNQDGRYAILLNPENGNLNLYSMDEFDFKIKESTYQDAQLLIKNYIGSNSRHPLSGVGIQKYLNAPIIDRKLNQRVLDELNSDGIVPNEVILNNGLISLDLKTNEENLGYEEQQIR